MDFVTAAYASAGRVRCRQPLRRYRQPRWMDSTLSVTAVADGARPP